MTDLHPILQFLVHYGYWLVIPVMIVEGPIIAIVMGFLASFGFFNIFLVILLAVIADLISDVFYYWSGYHGGRKVLDKLDIVRVRDNDALAKLKTNFEKHPRKIFFVAKILPGVTSSTLILAGVLKINYWTMLRSAVPGGIVWSAGLAAIGYYFGEYAGSINQIITRTGVILFTAFMTLLLYKLWIGKLIAKKFTLWKEKNNGD